MKTKQTSTPSAKRKRNEVDYEDDDDKGKTPKSSRSSAKKNQKHCLDIWWLHELQKYFKVQGTKITRETGSEQH